MNQSETEHACRADAFAMVATASNDSEHDRYEALLRRLRADIHPEAVYAEYRYTQVSIQ